MDRIRALVVDDEQSVCASVKAILETEGFDVSTTLSSTAALEMIKTRQYDLIISDLRMPEINGMELYERTRESSPGSVYIIITAYGTITSAIEAVKMGIYDYIPKPFTPDEVRLPVRRALEKRRLEMENIALKSQVDARYSFKSIIGSSPAISELFRVMRHAASSDSTVLITGESGTGKELVARAVHSNSVRAKRKFVAVNCGAIPDGLLESELFGYVKGAFTGANADKRGLLEEAHRGTLFLDEVGELSPAMQVKLLRAIQDGEFMKVGEPQSSKVDVRVIAATNMDLAKAMAERTFREDLYYRLNVIPIYLPPLRTRKDDIPLLVSHFLSKHSPKSPEKTISCFSRAALHSMLGYHWPGNVRELENAVEYAITFTSGGEIDIRDLPKYITEGKNLPEGVRDIPIIPLKEAKTRMERSLITAALIEAGGNISEAARLLQIHRQNLQQKIKLLGIDLSSIACSPSLPSS